MGLAAEAEVLALVKQPGTSLPPPPPASRLPLGPALGGAAVSSSLWGTPVAPVVTPTPSFSAGSGSEKGRLVETEGTGLARPPGLPPRGHWHPRPGVSGWERLPTRHLAPGTAHTQLGPQWARPLRPSLGSVSRQRWLTRPHAEGSQGGSDPGQPEPVRCQAGR